MNFDEEEDDEDEISSSSSQLNSNTRPGSATSKKSCKVKKQRHDVSCMYVDLVLALIWIFETLFRLYD